MKDIKHLVINTIFALLLVFTAMPVAAQGSNIQDFIIGTGSLSRLGSLFITSDTNEDLETNAFFRQSASKASDCRSTSPGAQKETCLQVNGLAYLRSLTAKTPVSVIGQAGVGTVYASDLGSEKLLVKGNILDWALALRDETTQIPAPQDLTSLRTVCADSSGKLIICGEETSDFDFNFVTMDETQYAGSGTLGVSGEYGSNDVVLSLPSGQAGAHATTAWNSLSSKYVALLRIDGTGSFDDIECEYSGSPIGYERYSEPANMSYGPRSLSTMHWEAVSTTNVLQSYIDSYSGSGLPSIGVYSSTLYISPDTNNPSAPFYALTTFDLPQYDSPHFLNGYVGGVVRCREKGSAQTRPGSWKYQNLLPPVYPPNDKVSLTRAQHSKVINWNAAQNDTVPSSFWYTLKREECDYQATNPTGNYNLYCDAPETIATIQGTSYEVTDMNLGCSDTIDRYYVIVSMCNPAAEGLLSAGSCYDVIDETSGSNPTYFGDRKSDKLFVIPNVHC